VGTNAEDAESGQVHIAGLVLREVPRAASNFRSTQDFRAYLEAHRVVAIAGIDTRRLTRILRDKGAQNGCIVAGGRLSEKKALEAARSCPGLQGADLAKVVSCAQTYAFRTGSWQLDGNREPVREGGRHHVVVYDFGVKRNILRMLVDRDCRVTVVPAQTPAEAVFRLKPDGVLLSNGPGDPEPCSYAITAARTFIARKLPVFGICLGHQILGLAAGARTVKMKFGHHGANHPVQDLQTGRVLITSQNHGFAVDEASLPAGVRVTHKSLFDGSLQGIALDDAPAFSFQGHPEASPGPHDVAYLFDRFVQLMAR
jgi:carbamoyl-phosphate synthase small subunit